MVIKYGGRQLVRCLATGDRLALPMIPALYSVQLAGSVRKYKCTTRRTLSHQLIASKLVPDKKFWSELKEKFVNVMRYQMMLRKALSNAV